MDQGCSKNRILFKIMHLANIFNKNCHKKESLSAHSHKFFCLFYFCKNISQITSFLIVNPHDTPFDFCMETKSTPVTNKLTELDVAEKITRVSNDFIFLHTILLL